MVRMNKQMNIPEMQRVMMEFEKQSDIMDMKVGTACLPPMLLGK